MNEALMTTGAAAEVLGVSRQHVVNLCNRGDLFSTRVGAHRRVRASDVEALRRPPMREERQRALWLHRAVLGELVQDPARVIAMARANVARATEDLPRSKAYLVAWDEILDAGVEAIADACTGLDEWSGELRQNSPFAGVLSDDRRMAVLRSFRSWRSR